MSKKNIATYKYEWNNLIIRPRVHGADSYIKISYPMRYGIYGEIRMDSYVFTFRPSGEIKTIANMKGGWLDSSEWLKRTIGNDWIYFSAGGYTGAVDFIGEYYIPYLSYESNSIFGADRFKAPEVREMITAWERLHKTICESLQNDSPPSAIRAFFEKIAPMSPAALQARADKFHCITDGIVSVLPPDSRHVEYEVIPVNISGGCLYKCRFCRVKNHKKFSVFPPKEVERKIDEMAEFLGPEAANMPACFLGQHDALLAGEESIIHAAIYAYERFGMAKANIKEPKLFLFASADALLSASHNLFGELNKLPFMTYINVGLESADTQTLARLGKPISKEKVRAAFKRMMDINRTHPNIEISANFVIGEDLPENHEASILEMIEKEVPRPYPKGTIYLSPLGPYSSRDRFINNFIAFKNACRLPAFLYLIQRL